MLVWCGLAIVVINAVVLSLVSLVTEYEGHHTMGKVQKWITTKSYCYLMLNSLFLPGVMFTSLNAGLVVYNNTADKLEFISRLFLLNSGEFFFNLIMQAGLLGAGCQLVHIPERAIWATRTLWAKLTSQPDNLAIDLWSFQWGYHYAYASTVFAIGITFSVNVPLLTFAAWGFLLVKLGVDKYDILLTCKRDQVELHGQWTVVKYPIISLLVLNISLAAHLILVGAAAQGGLVLSIAAVSVIGLSLLLFDVGPAASKRPQGEQVGVSQMMTSPDAHLPPSEAAENQMATAYIHPLRLTYGTLD